MWRSLDRRARPGAGRAASPAAPVALTLCSCALVLVSCGCGGAPHGALVANQRPLVTISSGPIERGTGSYQVRVDWYAFDPDGQVVRVLYAADPPLAGDTTWTAARQNFAFFTFADTSGPLPTGAPPIVSLGYHTVVLKAIDNDGQASRPVCRSFTPTTVAPYTTITAPVPSSEVAASSPPSLFVQWQGVDPDGPSGLPDHYVWAVVPGDSINPSYPVGVTREAVAAFFARDVPTRFASWNRLAGNVTSLEIHGLDLNRTYYFALVAFDEAGAFDPRFSLDANVLGFRPILSRKDPVLTVFNAFYWRTQIFGGIDLSPDRFYPVSVPAGVPVTFNWIATAAQGSAMGEYRWALDLVDSGVGDTTVRADSSDVTHWSAWSSDVTHATVGPFTAPPAGASDHLFYVEARDVFGAISLLVLDLRIIAVDATRPLLVVDDLNGAPTERNRTTGAVTLKNPYPMEAEQDSFYFARGGFPDSLRILSGTPGAVSVSGTFSHFDFDTLDYGRGWPDEGVALDELAKYKVVCWYTDQVSASAVGSKFGSARPMTAIRLMNSVNHANALAQYLSAGGKAWFFGDGTTTAIANGYSSRYSLYPVPRLPYTANRQPRDVLQPGSFLWDYLHLRSQVDLADRSAVPLTANARLIACLPYLPQYRLPPGQPVPADRSLDPHIGASAQRTLDDGWGGLPRLTVGAYRGIPVDPATGYGDIAKTAVITKPLYITEGTATGFGSVADTLYLCQSLRYDPNNADDPTSDGYPNAIVYYGSEHGEVVWMGFPLYVMQPDQARQLADLVLTHLGVPPALPGTAGAHAASRSRPAL